MTFSSFLFGLIILYGLYYGCAIFFDMNKKTQKKDGDDYSDIGIDTDEFKAIDASSIYSVEESPVQETSVEESPVQETSVEESPVVSTPVYETKTPEEAPEEAPEVESEEEFAKHTSSVTNHGGIEIYDAKKMIREMGENPFSGTANEYLKFI